MENQLLGQILNNIVMEKAVRDKIVIQQKEQQAGEARKRAREEDDQFMDEEAEQIFQKMREERLRDLGKGDELKLQKSMGQYRQIVESQFLNYVTKNRRAVVHFYHEEFQKCKIVEKHLRIIAGKHPESVFLYIDSKKAPFFVTKLAIRVLPCVCLFINGVLRDKIVGFQGLGNGEDISTMQLTRKLIALKVIDELPEERFKIKKRDTEEEEDDDLGLD